MGGQWANLVGVEKGEGKVGEGYSGKTSQRGRILGLGVGGANISCALTVCQALF